MPRPVGRAARLTFNRSSGSLSPDEVKQADVKQADVKQAEVKQADVA